MTQFTRKMAGEIAAEHGCHLFYIVATNQIWTLYHESLETDADYLCQGFWRQLTVEQFIARCEDQQDQYREWMEDME